MLGKVKEFMGDESGQAMTEYGLIIALIAVVVVGALATMGQSLLTKFGVINTNLQ